MKSILNFRPLFVIFLGIILGAIYFVSIVNIVETYWLCIFICVTLALVLMMVYVVLGALKLKGGFFEFLTSTYKVWLTMFISVVAFRAIFSSAYAIKSSKLCEIDGCVNYNGVVTTVDVKDSYIVCELRDVKYGSNTLNSNLNVIIYTKGTNIELGVGDRLSSAGYIERLDIDNFAVLNYSAIYKTNTNISSVEVVDGSPNFFESIKLAVRNVLNDNMSIQNANISYAMIFGEKDGIDNNISNIFSIAGISHILAVSGLHIGVLVSVLLFILDKCKTKRWISFMVMSILLLLYMVLCNFTPSVVRASIMALVMYGATMSGKRYDSLTSLSIAGIILAIFNPFVLYSVGFQLSFACVFAIITISPSITNMFKKMKFDNAFARNISLSLSISIALIPFCAHYFHRISLLAVLTNTILIPVFSIAYILLLICVLLAIIIKVFGVLLVIPETIIHFIRLLANAVANLKYSYILVFDVSVITFTLFMATQYILQFLVVRDKLKAIIVSVLSVFIIISLIFDFLPNKYYKDSINCFSQNYSNMVVIYSDNNEVTLVGFDDYDFKVMTDYLCGQRINKVNNIVIYDKVSKTENLEQFIRDYSVDRIYSTNCIDNTYGILNIVGDKFTIGGIEYNFVVKDKCIALSIYNGDKYTLIANELNKDDAVYISNLYSNQISYVIVGDISCDISKYMSYDELITQNNEEIDSNIVLNKSKIWYASI